MRRVSNDSSQNVTELLRAWGHGDLGARDRLMPLVYDELRRQAAARLRREPPGRSSSPRSSSTRRT